MKEYSETEIVEKADKDEVLTKVETPEFELPKLEDEIQNAKLAAQSSGWKIEIKSITQAKDEGIKYRRLENAQA